MPTYEYACTSCGEHLEVVQSFKDAPLSECPACGGPLRKVFAPIGVVFKGSGFYKTDSRPSKTSKTSTASEASSTSSSSSESGSATTPATSTPPAPAKTETSSSGSAAAS